MARMTRTTVAAAAFAAGLGTAWLAAQVELPEAKAAGDCTDMSRACVEAVART